MDTWTLSKYSKNENWTKIKVGRLNDKVLCWISKPQHKARHMVQALTHKAFFLLFSLKSLKIKNFCFELAWECCTLLFTRQQLLNVWPQTHFWKMGYLLLLAVAMKIEILKPLNSLHAWRKHRSCVFCRIQAWKRRFFSFGGQHLLNFFDLFRVFNFESDLSHVVFEC